jgi:hypothetical protein
MDGSRRRHAAARSRVAAGALSVAVFLGLGANMVAGADGATDATDGSAAHVRALLDEVDPARRAVDRFAVHSATLDDVFLALTGHPADRRKETADV